jgi:hypothetical protein
MAKVNRMSRKLTAPQCLFETTSKKGWSMSDEDGAILGTILALHDQQLAAVAVHQLSAARERLNRFIVSEQISPIPAGTAI